MKGDNCSYYVHGLFPLSAYAVPPRHSFQRFIKCWCYCPHFADKETEVQKGEVATQLPSKESRMSHALTHSNLKQYEATTITLSIVKCITVLPCFPPCSTSPCGRNYALCSLKADSAMWKVSRSNRCHC